jgi:YVTN family beta-propeller protein
MRCDAARHLLHFGVTACALAAMLLGAMPGRAEAPLVLEAKIPLGAVSGRIDHMAIDLARRRLFVAELGNDSLGIVDLATRQVIRRVPELREPQGVGYVAATDTVYVASARDGRVRLFHSADYAAAGRIALGEDADDIRVDAKTGLVFVGYGAGGIAMVDTASTEKRADIRLPGHPEGFALAPEGDRIFANVPDAGQIAVIDRAQRRQVAAWPLREARANFPMAIEGAGEAERVITVFRQPARLAALSARDGSMLASLDTCADADDVFVDARRQRLYVSCGAGAVDVLQRRGEGYQRLGRVSTAPGARTSLFVPELDRLYVAVRSVGATTPAAIWVFRPAP